MPLQTRIGGLNQMWLARTSVERRAASAPHPVPGLAGHGYGAVGHVGQGINQCDIALISVGRVIMTTRKERASTHSPSAH